MNKPIDKNELLKDYKKVFAPSQLERLKSLGHDFIEAKREGSFIFDTEGKKYIDCSSSASIYNLGRRQPELIQALRNAVKETDQGNFPMVSIEKASLAKRLAEFVPGNLECTVYSVIRGESIDFACKLARGYTKRKEYISVDGSWFGQTGFAMSLSDRADMSNYGVMIPETKKIPFNNIDAAEKMITKKTAAVFVEPVQAENGCRVADNEYLQALCKICKKNKTLLVLDETQSGLGRSGSKFAFEKAGIVPDVLVIGEALGGGIFPIAATIYTQKLNKFMNKHPMIHLSTFGGADQGCRVAIKALELYDSIKPWENAEKCGKILMEGLLEIKGKNSDKILSVSGKGLLLSLQFKSPVESKKFCKAAAGNGLLLSPGELAKDCVIFRPGLLIEENDIRDIISAASKSVETI